MIEILSAIVANGTMAFNWGYRPGLPFNEFIPVLIVMAFVGYLITRDVLGVVIFLVSGCLALIPTWLIWSEWAISPVIVFGIWFVSTVIIGVSLLWCWAYLSFTGEEDRDEHRRV